MNTTINPVLRAAGSVIFLLLLGGCGGVSELTNERVARAETSVQQASLQTLREESSRTMSPPNR